MSNPTATTATAGPGTVPDLADQEPLPWSTIYQLLKFRYDNTPGHLRTGMVEPDPDLDMSADLRPELLRELITFAGSNIGNGDPTRARQLEAYRVVQLVPETYGCALFGVPTRA